MPDEEILPDEAVPERRDVPSEDEERGRYTEGNYGGGGAVSPEDRGPAGEEDNYTAGDYPEGREESGREDMPDKEVEGEDPDLAVRPPDE